MKNLLYFILTLVVPLFVLKCTDTPPPAPQYNPTLKPAFPNSDDGQPTESANPIDTQDADGSLPTSTESTTIQSTEVDQTCTIGFNTRKCQAELDGENVWRAGEYTFIFTNENNVFKWQRVWQQFDGGILSQIDSGTFFYDQPGTASFVMTASSCSGIRTDIDPTQFIVIFTRSSAAGNTISWNFPQSYGVTPTSFQVIPVRNKQPTKTLGCFTPDGAFKENSVGPI